MSGVAGFSGADADQLDGLARLFEESAARINEIVGSARTLAQEAVWAGADAEQFRRDVNDELGGAAGRAAEVVRAAGEQVRREAAQQRDASGSVTAGSTVGGAAFGGGVIGGAALASSSPRGISDVVAGGPRPQHDWHASPRVASLIDLVRAESPAPAGQAVVGDLVGAGSATPLLQADTLDVPSNWARRALGLE